MKPSRFSGPVLLCLAVAAAPGILCSVPACGGAGGSAASGPVARYPFVEYGPLRLAREVLSLEVLPDRVAVDVIFEFQPTGQSAGDVAMFFPVPARRRAEVCGFEASASSIAGGETIDLEASPCGPSLLPVGGVPSRSWQFIVPGSSFAGAGGSLRVKYSQRASNKFKYILKSGAYWSGSIGILDVDISDTSGRLIHAEVEGEPPHSTSPGSMHWSFTDIEPRSGVKLLMVPVAQAPGGSPGCDGDEEN